MNNPYELQEVSKLYREERLQEAQRRHLLQRARAERVQQSRRSHVASVWEDVLSLMCRARPEH